MEEEIVIDPEIGDLDKQSSEKKFDNINYVKDHSN